MTPVILTILAFSASFIAFVRATDSNNTGCYKYFLQKDGCVWGSLEDPCPNNSTKGKPACTSLHAVSSHYTPISLYNTIISLTISLFKKIWKFQHNTVPIPKVEIDTESDDLEHTSYHHESSKKLVRRYDTTIPVSFSQNSTSASVLP